MSANVGRTVGVEDLFSKDDFRMLLEKCGGHTINDQHLSNVTNSEYAKSTGVEAVVARDAYESNDLNKTTFYTESTQSI